ncbi:thioesterase II family protein [Streptomyces goshikiensis]|uniref:thioesterase II family protein n=1 Tax=Streptomyces goshikiensis TaxID=1942 RepID=UPI00364BB8CF
MRTPWSEGRNEDPMNGPHHGIGWLRRFHARPDAGRRLVCLPHAGGSASAYFPLSEALSSVADVEVLVVQYPGRQDRRRVPHVGIPAMAEQIAGELAAFTDRPMTVFGHSMGATVGYEVARRLQPQPGASPHLLIASGQRAPETQSRRPVRELHSDGEFIDELVRLGGTDARLLTDRDLLSLFLPPLREDYAALRAYQHLPGPRLQCPVVALIGDRDPRVSVEEAGEWAGTTDGSFELRGFRGGHFYLEDRRAEFLDTMAELLTRYPPSRPDEPLAPVDRSPSRSSQPVM